VTFVVMVMCVSLAGPSAVAQQQDAGLDFANSLSRAFQRVAMQLEPSVVHITSMRRIWMRRSLFDPGRQEIAPTGLGSGVIVSKDGYILTNNHVVAGAEKLVVRLYDGTQYDAEIIDRDPVTDLAVLSIDAEGLTPATFGNSDDLEVGQWVVAVGSPFGFANTVTAGIVSAIGRTGLDVSNQTFKEYQEYIQTDAAINPGNSGGPLVNLKGEVVGINTAIASRSGGSVGIGFATPSAVAQLVLDDILAGRGVDHGSRGAWLGVEMEPLDQDTAEQLGLGDGERRGGVRVVRVVEDSPAARAGLHVGDIITRFRDRPTLRLTTLRNMIVLTPPGTTTPIEIVRDGTRRKLRVRLEDREEAELAMMGAKKLPWLGMTLAPLEGDLAKLVADKDAKGLLVLEVQHGSAADASGFEPKDLIVSITIDGDQTIPMTSVDRLEQVLKSVNLRRQSVRVNAIRNGLKGYIMLGAR
jgi:serine protease Do